MARRKNDRDAFNRLYFKMLNKGYVYLGYVRSGIYGWKRSLPKAGKYYYIETDVAGRISRRYVCYLYRVRQSCYRTEA